MARKKLETLTEPMYYILLSLYEEPRHGYGIMQYINQMTNGRVIVGAGTLYALLARFEEEQLILLTRTSEGRKYYTLSETGKESLLTEFNRLNRQLDDGAQVLKRRSTP